MTSEAERSPLGVFECQLCALTAPYSYVGQKPPNTQSVLLLEESYIMKDPFSPDRGRFLVLGAQCSVCSRLVCVGPVGMQSVLLQEVLSALRPEEPQRLPARNPARPGEEESPLLQAALGQGLSWDMSAACAEPTLGASLVPGSRSAAEQAGHPQDRGHARHSTAASAPPG
ncbi:cysteine-rich DPF motif domain-containing protein 1 isoform X1 [Heterocephalus glaber]|uniref:Cysteine-rich DPF motif domain-containing protein 1 n=1 Tax=Heterocephalus glaber TaxID=10181 RepID=A0AAX6T1S8_HETGA|nr:cysteine-rich DPF motif domain-containing protein 1 isoform X1 [Heterocephalus glaber]XP_021114457.1 cysteine-rich DPF motif domain-containing protein 1 isoform X1 [Heterocephalus glaber]XP_021114458.1 cysteine-rich DPF motif domain-containing protein 1 isoform X1 [Heterocephalus glaber]XP_021114459.1 cysteine-rich DPF motif domain-containing protein 1 isoform X1 [Heterocephalus glaber]